MNQEMLTNIEKFLSSEKQRLGVISTVSKDNTPESAFVYYSFDKDMNIYFATRVDSRKYKNFLENNHMSFAVATENPPQTLQLEGVASVAGDTEAQKKLYPELVTLSAQRTFAPPIVQMESSELKFIKITPTWIRFGDFTVRKHGDTFQEEKIG